MPSAGFTAHGVCLLLRKETAHQRGAASDRTDRSDPSDRSDEVRHATRPRCHVPRGSTGSMHRPTVRSRSHVPRGNGLLHVCVLPLASEPHLQGVPEHPVPPVERPSSTLCVLPLADGWNAERPATLPPRGAWEQAVNAPADQSRRSHVPRGSVFRVFVAGTLRVPSAFPLFGLSDGPIPSPELRHTECACYTRCLSASLSPGHSSSTVRHCRCDSSKSPRSRASAARFLRVRCP